MANGFVRHKKVQWVFQTTYELNQFRPKDESVYALDNSQGDIYIWNGSQWILYYQYAVKIPAREPKVRPYHRNNPTPDFSGGDTIYNDVDIIRGNYMFVDGNMKYEITMYNNVSPLTVGNYVESVSSHISGSMYTDVSMSVS